MDKKVQADGDPATAELMIVGEAPGEQELVEGRPFVGKSGRLFWTTATRAGIDRKSCYVTNAVQSRPDTKSGKPSQRQIYAEAPRLAAELEAFQGRVLLLLGAVPFSRLLGLPGGITANRGYVCFPNHCRPIQQKRRIKVGEYKTSRKGKYAKGDPKYADRLIYERPVLPPNVEYIIPTLHPSGIMRQTNFEGIVCLRKDLQRVRRALDGKLRLLNEPNYLNIPYPPIPPDRPTTIDIETDYESGAINRVGVAWTDDKHGTKGWTAPWDVIAAREVEQAWDAPNEKRFHNAAFDVPRLEAAFGRPMNGPLFDTMWAQQVLHPDLPRGLQKVAPFYLDITPWKHLAGEEAELYNAKDAVAQEMVARAEIRALEFTQQTQVAERINRGLPYIIDMSRRGIRTDAKEVEAFRTREQARLESAQLAWPFPDVNYNSHKQVTRLLYDRLRLPRQFSKHGTPTADAAALGKLRRYLEARGEDQTGERWKVVETLAELRAAEDNVSIYGSTAIDDDGYVHPEYLPTSKEEASASDKFQGARTGRIQPRRPNIANQHGEARKMYVSDPGNAWVAVDWKQAEAWIEQACSKDERLAEALSTDLHGYIQRSLGVDRVRAKNMWYGTGRLASPRTICATLNAQGYSSTIKECEEMQQELYHTFDKWARWRFKVINQSIAQGYVREPLGGRRYYLWAPRWRVSQPRIIGYIPQAGVGSALWDRIPVVAQAAQALGGRLTLTVHDEFIAQCPAANARVLGNRMQEVLECEWPGVAPGFRFQTDIEIGEPGESWGAMNARYKACS